jgi:hypothetical protein
VPLDASTREYIRTTVIEAFKQEHPPSQFGSSDGSG